MRTKTTPSADKKTASKTVARRRKPAPDAIESGTAKKTTDFTLGAELPQFVGYAVRTAEMRVGEHFFAALAGQHITPARFTLLLVLRSNPGIRSTDLARILKCARSGLVKLVDFLEERQMVTREITQSDRRNQSLTLTALGQRKLKEMELAVLRHEEEICARISAEERVQLLDILSRLAR